MSTFTLNSPTFEAAVQRIRTAARTACDRAAESLGLAALSAPKAIQREVLQSAQVEISRKQSVFAQAFDETLDRLIAQELQGRVAAVGAMGVTHWDWESLSLVADHEIDLRVRGERLGFELGRGCEWERREFESFLGPLLAAAGVQVQDTERNPLRPENIGFAIVRGAGAITEVPDLRLTLEGEIGRSMAAEMAATYAGIVADLRAAGLKPAGLSVKVTDSGPAVRRRGSGGSEPGANSASTGPDSVPASQGGSGPSSRQDRSGSAPEVRGRLGAAMGRVSAQVMSLMRQLTQRQQREEGFSVSQPSPLPASGDEAGAEPPDRSAEGVPLVARNVIRAHREALREATRNELDHRVIDVVGSLFDQILSDPKVPPQMARQIGRLQLPVLRAAMGDTSFFASRRHPVRRFVNRLASLACALDGLDEAGAAELLQRVSALVQQVIEGDFEQMGVYEQKLAMLEAFVAEQARQEAAASGDPAPLLGRKEAELQLQQRYARQLQRELVVLTGPEFLRDFLAQVWSRTLVKAHLAEGDETQRQERLTRLRYTARDLYMSVQPKGAAIQRKAFLAQLPRLMQTLNDELDALDWPDESRKVFFSELLPAHAHALRGDGLSTLDFNLLARQVDAIFEAPLPTAADPLPGGPAPVPEEAVAQVFSAEEAARAGLADERRFTLETAVEPDPAAEPAPAPEDLAIAGLPEPEPAEPTSGAALADQVQLGYAYRMHVDGQWRKVRLTHVSPGRNFFVFTRGREHPQAISLTRRMLVRLCEADRLRTYESAWLLERATARARRQLASLSPR